MSANTRSWIGFLSDYGLSDCHVGVCHGVIATTAPTARVIDLCHEVPPGDLRRGGALLAQAAPYLPPGVLLAVVDPATGPGAGTRRRALAVTAGRSVLVGPDNGLLLPAARALGGASAAYAITSRTHMRHPVSATFRGRDLFAPVAAHIAAGLSPAALGPEVPVEALVHLPEPVARLTAHRLEGVVLSVDRWGTVQTTLGAGLFEEAGLRVGDTLTVHCRTGEVRVPFGRSHADVRPGEAVGYLDSAGLFALARHTNSAAEELGLQPGDSVAVRLPTAVDAVR
ncbi:SAM-dependent chlorinase/fluorinase [Actinospica durhamensis]|uniref:SAM-dependent chlorinase/fluorinase n=1 Tax=Actinospica durhamensis TaxID=1508375 RepID=A0A941ELM8_9ACTN|nr:SAM-dependent chlorinase/fluorinase [Actinospica durhamensis]MBR7832623.1 SAM-dependent chlorinase/fluorinase [Actinospica durhamensis]